ncbi:hypothetical protein MARA_01720 (plasmid) [Mycolicibacterium arabiense]|uniref:Transmembrane protein n=1 Tax=Mycolicibacterium arabiense TaxID=1286181 RepID=A0A7I7RQ89_9MYCO|nr:DUF5336 domain-containing protein [Mycolicibacterium arabiense]MCV7376931.1 DUF5336 domain-containing protein [Mycolicibacterium arabiense]BBY46742.1 hypothetical protein MARA_01720 [Mycolicibacterium arabiense]
MTNPPEHPVHAGPADFFDWTSSAIEAGSKRNRLRGSLWAAVVVLGLAAYGVDFFSPVSLGIPVHLPVLAAGIAAVGLLPRQRVHGWLVAPVAVTAFLAAVTTCVTSGGVDWTLVAITVLDGLQSLAAVGALLQHDEYTESGGRSDHMPDYSAYANLTLAYQAYAAHYQRSAATQSTAGQGAGDGRASAAAPARAAGTGSGATTHSFEDLQARYLQYGAGDSPPPARHPGSAAAPAGPAIPGADHGSATPTPYRRQDDSGGRGVGLSGH